MDVPYIQFVQQIAQASDHVSAWLQFLAGPITGAATALIATWLAHRFSSTDATRVEHLKRKLVALESFAEGVIQMQTDVYAVAQAAYNPNWERWCAVFDSQSGLSKATAVKMIYFADDFASEWADYLKAYDVLRLASMKVAHLAQKRLKSDSTQLMQEYDAAHSEKVALPSLYVPRNVLLKSVNAKARQLEADS